MGLAPWDVAAGSLLVLEAGGLMGDFQGKSLDAAYIFSREVVAATPKVFAPLLSAISIV